MRLRRRIASAAENRCRRGASSYFWEVMQGSRLNRRYRSGSNLGMRAREREARMAEVRMDRVEVKTRMDARLHSGLTDVGGKVTECEG